MERQCRLLTCNFAVAFRVHASIQAFRNVHDGCGCRGEILSFLDSFHSWIKTTALPPKQASGVHRTAAGQTCRICTWESSCWMRKLPCAALGFVAMFRDPEMCGKNVCRPPRSLYIPGTCLPGHFACSIIICLSITQLTPWLGNVSPGSKASTVCCVWYYSHRRSRSLFSVISNNNHPPLYQARLFFYFFRSVLVWGSSPAYLPLSLSLSLLTDTFFADVQVDTINNLDQENTDYSVYFT